MHPAKRLGKDAYVHLVPMPQASQTFGSPLLEFQGTYNSNMTVFRVQDFKGVEGPPTTRQRLQLLLVEAAPNVVHVHARFFFMLPDARGLRGSAQFSKAVRPPRPSPPIKGIRRST